MYFKNRYANQYMNFIDMCFLISFNFPFHTPQFSIYHSQNCLSADIFYYNFSHAVFHRLVKSRHALSAKCNLKGQAQFFSFPVGRLPPDKHEVNSTAKTI